MKQSDSKDKVRVGIVGVGNWAKYGHIPALRLLPGYEITAVSSRRLETAQDIATAFGIRRAFSDYHQLVSHPDVPHGLVFLARSVSPRAYCTGF